MHAGALRVHGNRSLTTAIEIQSELYQEVNRRLKRGMQQRTGECPEGDSSREFQSNDAYKVGNEDNMRHSRLTRLFVSALALVLIQRIVVLVSAIGISKQRDLPLNAIRLWPYNYAHFDGGWYIKIAQNGYTTLKETAWWPLYPLTMRAFHAVTGISYATSGVIISICCFVLAVFILGLLAERHFGFQTAFITMVCFAFYPTTYYFDSVYTEALFVLLAVSSIYAANTNRFVLSAILAALTTLTRNTGVLLCLVFVFEYARSRSLTWRLWQPAWWGKLDWTFCWVVLPPFTLVGYCLWLKSRFGNPLAFISAEKLWYRSYMSPWDVVRNTLYLYRHPHATVMEHAYIWFELASFAFAVLLLTIGLFYIRKSISHFSLWLFILAGAWLTSTEPSMDIPDYLVSFPRYVLMLFPGFIYLGQTVRKMKWLLVPILVFFIFYLYRKSGQFYVDEWIA